MKATTWQIAMILSNNPQGMDKLIMNSVNTTLNIVKLPRLTARLDLSGRQSTTVASPRPRFGHLLIGLGSPKVVCPALPHCENTSANNSQDIPFS